MWKYFQRIENCRHRPFERFWQTFGIDPSRHGWSGWLPTEKAAPDDAIADGQIRKVIARVGEQHDEGVRRAVAVAPRGAVRSERLARRRTRRDRRALHAADDATTISASARASGCSRWRNSIPIGCGSSCTRSPRGSLFDDRNRAIGVEYQKGERLYAAHPSASDRRRRDADRVGAARGHSRRRGVQHAAVADAVRHRRSRRARRGAAFRTRVPLPGVGRNLQDRYEVAVVNRMKKPWEALNGATFTTADPQYRDLGGAAQRRLHHQRLAAVRDPALRAGKPVPDLFCYALLADFRGYQPGYSERSVREPRLSDVGRAQRPHEQSRRLGDDHVSRSARAAGDQFPLFRRRHRCRRRRSAGGRRRRQARPPDDRRHEARSHHATRSCRATT